MIKKSVAGKSLRGGSNSTKQAQEFFISNVFAEKVFDQISAKQDTMQERFESQIARLEEKVKDVQSILEVELPTYEERITVT